MALGPLLRRLRTTRGLTQRQLSAQTGIRQAQLSELESGKRRDAQGTTLWRLAQFFGVSVEELLRGKLDGDPRVAPHTHLRWTHPTVCGGRRRSLVARKS